MARLRRRGQPTRQRPSERPNATRAGGPGDPAPSTPALGRALKEAREKAGLNQREAAKKIGVHFVTVHTWESPRRRERPTDASLARIAKAYGTSESVILRRAAAFEPGAKAGLTAGQDSRSDSAPRTSRAAADVGTHGASAPVAKQRERRIRARGLSRRRAAGVSNAMKSSPAGTGPSPARAHDQTQSPARDTSLDSSVVGSHGKLSGLPRRAYSRVLRVLADLAERSEFSPSQLASLQGAMTAPALMDVFAALTPQTMSEDDYVAAIDATAAAVQAYLSAQQR